MEKVLPLENAAQGAWERAAPGAVHPLYFSSRRLRLGDLAAMAYMSAEKKCEVIGLAAAATLLFVAVMGSGDSGAFKDVSNGVCPLRSVRVRS